MRGDIFYCKKCERFRGFYEYEDYFECVGCKSKILKEKKDEENKAS